MVGKHNVIRNHATGDIGREHLAILRRCQVDTDKPGRRHGAETEFTTNRITLTLDYARVAPWIRNGFTTNRITLTLDHGSMCNHALSPFSKQHLERENIRNRDSIHYISVIKKKQTIEARLKISDFLKIKEQFQNKRHDVAYFLVYQWIGEACAARSAYF